MSKATLTPGDLELSSNLVVLLLLLYQQCLESLVLRYYGSGFGLHKLQWVNSARGYVRISKQTYWEQVSSRLDSRHID